MTAVKVRFTFPIESVDPLNGCTVRIYCNGELALHTIMEKLNTKKYNWSTMISIDMDEGKEYNFALFFSDTDAHDIKFKHLEINDNTIIFFFDKTQRHFKKKLALLFHKKSKKRN